jgi:hypothetical protein
MLFCERGTAGGPIATASVAFDPDVAAMSAVPVKVALSVQNERRDTDIPGDCAARADGIPYEAAFSVEEISRWRWLFVFWIVRRHRHAVYASADESLSRLSERFRFDGINRAAVKGIIASTKLIQGEFACTPSS